MSSYKSDLEIDKYNLDEEWEKQPMLYMKWAEKHAEAVRKRDLTWQKKKVLKAELDGEVRKSFIEKGEKFTENIVDAEIRKKSEFKEVQKDLIEANEEVNVLESAKWAMEHKKKALESMTSLWIGGYYSEPKIPAQAKEDSYKKHSEKISKIHREKSGLKKRRG